MCSTLNWKFGELITQSNIYIFQKMAQARGNRQRGRQPQGQQAQNRQELSMQNALATLKSMFETVDDNVIRV